MTESGRGASPRSYRRVVLRRRPEGAPVEDDFELLTEPVPVPGPGEVLVRNLHIGISPAARIRMSDRRSYAPPLELGETIYAPTVGVVESSHDDRLAPGDIVTLSGGWSEYAVVAGGETEVFDSALGQPHTALGVYGTSGFTAWAGVGEFGRIEPGSTLVVSAAAGAVGSLVAQIARLRGCRVVGVAGGGEKCALVVSDYGADQCVDHRSDTLDADLKAACPDGVDHYFDNVGGRVRDAVWPLLNQSGGVVVCGLISEYDDGGNGGPSWFPLLSRRLTVKGFLVRDHVHRRAEFLHEMSGWDRSGLLRYREEFHDGIEQAPEAFIRMLQGRNRGKTVVTVSPGLGVQ